MNIKIKINFKYLFCILLLKSSILFRSVTYTFPNEFATRNHALLDSGLAKPETGVDILSNPSSLHDDGNRQEFGLMYSNFKASQENAPLIQNLNFWYQLNDFNLGLIFQQYEDFMPTDVPPFQYFQVFRNIIINISKRFTIASGHLISIGANAKYISEKYWRENKSFNFDYAINYSLMAPTVSINSRELNNIGFSVVLKNIGPEIFLKGNYVFAIESSSFSLFYAPFLFENHQVFMYYNISSITYNLFTFYNLSMGLALEYKLYSILIIRTGYKYYYSWFDNNLYSFGIGLRKVILERINLIIDFSVKTAFKGLKRADFMFSLGLKYRQ